MIINMEEIMSTSDVSKNFSLCREKTKERSRTIIFKNNKPDLALLDIEEYERIMRIVDLLEDYAVIEMIEERRKNDNGVRYTDEDVDAILEQKRQELKASTSNRVSLATR